MNNIPKIGACLIVKNEAPVIERCLKSILPLVDYIMIQDTGSTDGTPEIIRNFLIDNVSGKVVEDIWVDFASNRTKALQQIREVDVDYVLIIDADEILEFDEDFQEIVSFKKSLNKDLYNITTKNGNISYQRPQLFKNKLDFYYKGVLHEFLETPLNISRDDVYGFVNKPSHDGNRSQNSKKFQDDAKTLEAILLVEQDPFMISRYMFYLAQSYKDYGDDELAIETYIKRSYLGYWKEEVYISLLNVARLTETLPSKYSDGDIIDAYMVAHSTLPTRLEALHDLVRYCRLKSYNDIGYRLATNWMGDGVPKGLFIEDYIYEYGLLFEFSILAYHVGKHEEAIAACDILLYKDIPDHIRRQVIKNRKFSEEKLTRV